MPDDHRGGQPLTPWQAWLSMFGIRAPLSGDVTQDIAPSIGGQLGLLNINATRSGDPGLEQRIITQVASSAGLSKLWMCWPGGSPGVASARRTSARWISFMI